MASERQQLAGEREPRQQRTAAESRVPPHADVLQLQRTAGNTAVTRLLASAPTLARYEGGEHAQFGGERKVTINGVELDEGELIALGDFFEQPEEIYRAPTEELLNLRTLIRRDKSHYSGKGGAAVSTGQWSTATAGRPSSRQYVELAKRNEAHFSPRRYTGGKPGTDNKSRWEELHLQAVGKVVEHTAGGGRGVPAEAVLINAFAAHFLTDAFAAGHLMHKDDVIDRARRMWDTQSTTGLIFKESRFTKAVARKVLSDPQVRKKIAGKQLRIVLWGELDEERFSEFLWQMEKAKPHDFHHAFARLVHDKLNESINVPGEQIEVANDRGMVWTLAGDGTLAQSPESLKIAKLAVDESYRNLEYAAAEPRSPDPAELLERVWSYVPKPTAEGRKILDTVRETLTDPRNQESIDAFAELAIDQFDAVLEELEKEGYVREKPEPVEYPPDYGMW